MEESMFVSIPQNADGGDVARFCRLIWYGRMGMDGDSKAPLNTKVSQDDIVRALDGGFIGLAEEF